MSTRATVKRDCACDLCQRARNGEIETGPEWLEYARHSGAVLEFDQSDDLPLYAAVVDDEVHFRTSTSETMRASEFGVEEVEFAENQYKECWLALDGGVTPMDPRRTVLADLFTSSAR
jgi:homogentisate 1,2-dioxygenase